ncbi:MAG: substrate-binding domain-containing protein [Bilophila wadsworthia]
MEGYKKVLADNGIPFDPELIRSQPPSYLLGKESMRAFLKLQDPPTAVLCVNDYLAIGAIRAITEAGLSVPEDISVCGFDDIDRHLLQPADEHQDALLRNGPDGGEHHDLDQ